MVSKILIVVILFTHILTPKVLKYRKKKKKKKSDHNKKTPQAFLFIYLYMSIKSPLVPQQPSQPPPLLPYYY